MVLRLGKYHRTITETKLKWPLLEQTRIISIANDIISLNEQTHETSDGVDVTISCVINYNVHNPKKASFNVVDYEDAIADVCLGEIGMAVADNTRADLKTQEFCDLLKALCHAETVKFGVTVNRVNVENLCKGRVLRHFGINMGESDE